MRKFILLTFTLGAVILLSVVAFAKTETDSPVAGSSVAYGVNGSTIVPLKVAVDGSVYVSGITGGGTSQWTTNGTAIYYNTGNIGLGSSVPGAKISVWGVGTTAATSSLNIRDSSGTLRTAFYDDGSIYNLGNIGVGSSAPTAKLAVVGNGNDATTDALRVRKLDGTMILVVNNAGNVGVGTSAPATQFEVVGGSIKGRIAKRAVTVTQSATPTINTDVTDFAYITGLAQAITSMTTNLSGNPVEGDVLRISITDDGTGRAITWGAKFEASGTAALPTTTVASTRLDVVFYWNSATTKWRCVGSS